MMRTSDKMLFKRIAIFCYPPTIVAIAIGIALGWNSEELGGATLLGLLLGGIAYALVDGPAIGRGERPEVNDPDSLDRL